MILSDYVNLGKSGLRVSPLCLGTMTFGEDWGEGSNSEESHRLMSKYIDLGGNFIDTANVYTSGESERIIGDFLRRRHCKRDDLVIATKFFGSDFTGDPTCGGASRKSIIAACENSLKRLQTDHIDLYWLHRWDKYTPIQETMSVLNDLVSQGKVRYIGFSDSPAWKIVEAQMIAEFRGWAPLIAMQNEYSLLERTVEDELIPMALELGMGLIPWAPLNMGILSGKFTRENRGRPECAPKEWQAAGLTEKAYRVIDELIKIGKQIGATPGQVALAWIRQRPCVSSSIILALNVQQLTDHIASLGVTLTEDHMRRLQLIADIECLENLLPQREQEFEPTAVAAQPISQVQEIFGMAQAASAAVG